MIVIRWVLIVWSVVGAAGAVVIFAALLDRPGASAMRVFPLVLWAALYGLNLYYLARTRPNVPAQKSQVLPR